MNKSEITKPNVRTEAVAGVTTFFTMAYIVVVNPSILSTPGTGMAFSGVLTATVLVCFVMTLFMGLYAKLPFAVAPGMGINAFFNFTIISYSESLVADRTGNHFLGGRFVSHHLNHAHSRNDRKSNSNRPATRHGCGHRHPPDFHWTKKRGTDCR